MSSPSYLAVGPSMLPPVCLLRRKARHGRTGKTIYLLLCGGYKGTQDADIKSAHAIWKVLNTPAKEPVK